MFEKFICFEGNEQFLHIQKYLLNLGKSFPSGRVYTSFSDFKKRNAESPTINSGVFIVLKDNDFTCNVLETDINYYKEHYPQVPLITYSNITCSLEIE